MNPTGARLDHLVVLAASLDEGMAWSEALLGVTPKAGGEHPLMGTHNLLLRIADPQVPAFSRSYLEILAIRPGATPTRRPPLKRWFDLDDEEIQARLRQQGPRLLHWVASAPDAGSTAAQWLAQGLDRGPLLQASRPSPTGLLQWQITVRDDGRRLLEGTLPTLIQWGPRHPVDTLPDCGLRLERFSLSHPDPAPLSSALHSLGLPLPLTSAPAGLQAVLTTPRGVVTLS